MVVRPVVVRSASHHVPAPDPTAAPPAVGLSPRAGPTQRVFLHIDGQWPTFPGPWEAGAAGEIPQAVEGAEARSVLNHEGLLAAWERWRQHGHRIVMDD